MTVVLLLLLLLLHHLSVTMALTSMAFAIVGRFGMNKTRYKVQTCADDFASHQEAMYDALSLRFLYGFGSGLRLSSPWQGCFWRMTIYFSPLASLSEPPSIFKVLCRENVKCKACYGSSVLTDGFVWDSISAMVRSRSQGHEKCRSSGVLSSKLLINE